jgi:hypothetical protein
MIYFSRSFLDERQLGFVRKTFESGWTVNVVRGFR